MVRIKCVAALNSCKWILSMLGMWINDNITVVQKIQIFVGICTNLAAILAIYQNIINSAKIKDYGYLNRMICLLLQVILFTAKWSTLMINQKNFQTILSDLGSRLFNAHSEILNQHIQYICRTSRILLLYFVIILGIYLLIGSILPMFVNIRPVIPSPFSTSVYDTVYKVVHLYICCHLALGVIGLDMLYLTLLSMGVAQLNILNGRLAKLEQDIEANNKDNKAVLAHGYNTVREIVRLHEAINRFIEKLNSFLSFPLFTQYVCGCFMVCNTVLQLTILREPGFATTFGMYCYTSLAFAQMSAYHFLGNEIMYKSNTLIQSSYSSTWYQLNLKSRKALVLIMERARKPLVIKAYKYIFINFDSLGVVVRWSYSLFAFIHNRYN